MGGLGAAGMPSRGPGAAGRWTRRGALRAGAGVLVAAGGAGLAACARAVGAAGATPSKPRTTLVWAPWRVAWGQGWDTVFLEAVQPFLQANPGVDVRIDVSTGNGSNDGGTIPLIVAGAAPDVYSGYGPTKMIEGGYNLDLSPYLKEQNVDTSVWDAGQYQKYVRNGSVWALPAELSTSAVAVNEEMLDNAGLAYPDPAWDYTAAAALWRQTTVHTATAAKDVTGFVFWGQKASWLPGDFYLRGWGASAAQSNFSALSGLDSAAAKTFAQWWYPLCQDGVIAWNGVAPSWPKQVACGFAGSWQLPAFAAQTSVKWDFWPQPAWPTGTSSYAGNDYYAVSSTTAAPALAAAFAIWLTTDIQWQHSLMALQLVVPPSSKLWSAWVEVIGAVAPPLKAKNIQAFMTAPLQGRAFNHPAFAYDSDSAYALMSKYMPQIVAGKLDPIGGVTGAAQAVNAFEAAAAAEAAAVTSESKAFPATGHPIAAVATGV